MVSGIFMNIALFGSEWVLYILIFTSLFSITLIYERSLFYREATRRAQLFGDEVRKAVHFLNYDKALRAAKERIEECKRSVPIDAYVTLSLIERKLNEKANQDSNSFFQVGQDALLRAKTIWEKNLSILASIGSNAPFIGLFGTVLGIIQAFHQLSGRPDGGAQAVTAGLADALIATAFGILVAIPAVFFYNHFQRRVEAAIGEAEALQNYLVSHLSSNSSQQSRDQN